MIFEFRPDVRGKRVSRSGYNDAASTRGGSTWFIRAGVVGGTVNAFVGSLGVAGPGEPGATATSTVATATRRAGEPAQTKQQQQEQPEEQQGSLPLAIPTGGTRRCRSVVGDKKR